MLYRSIFKRITMWTIIDSFASVSISAPKVPFESTAFK